MTLSTVLIPLPGRSLCRLRQLGLSGLLLAPCLLSTAVVAQQRPAGRSQYRPDSVAVGGTPDSLRVGVGNRRGDIETTVKYQAKDSIRFNVQERRAVLYNKASVDYGDMELKSGVITVDYTKNILTAEGLADSTGRLRDRPVFKDAAQTYQAGRIAYNFKSRKGKIAEAITQQGEGYVHAEVVKKNQFNEIYGLNGRYTTCNLEHPHFFINSTKMKVNPKKNVVSGPFNLVIGDIPTPLGFLFGYFPQPGKNRASGVIIPTFGQTVTRGFYLSRGGYYWAVNQYMGLAVTGSVYSGVGDQFGGWNGEAQLNYRKRYRYDGNLQFSYAEQPAVPLTGTEGLSARPELRRTFKPRTFWLNWRHSPTPRPGGGRFSADVQTGNPAFNQQNSINVRNYLTPAFRSGISYSKQLRNLPINYTLQANQDLNTINGTASLTLPNLSVQVQRQNLYRLLGIPTRDRFYEQFALGYNFTGTNTITNSERARTLSAGLPLIGGSTGDRTLPVRLSNLGPFLRNAQTSIRHDFALSLGNYTVLRHLSFTPNVNYSSGWYFKRLDYSYVREANAVRIDTVRGFYSVNNYSGGASLTTNLYGTINRRPGRKIQALRHRVSPSLNYTWSPDYISNDYYYQTPYAFLPADLRNAQGQRFQTEQFSRFQGFAGPLPGGRQSNVVSFSLQNQVEMKVRNSKDTTGNEPFKKVSLIDDLSLNASYDFTRARRTPGKYGVLSPISAGFRTQVAQKLNVQVSSTLNLYQRDSTGALLDRLLLAQPSPRLARLDQANVQLTYQFDNNRRPGQPARVALPNDPVLGNPNEPDPLADYIDFTIPWTLNASLGAFYQDPGPRLARANAPRQRAWGTVSANFSGDVKLTDKMRFGYSSGYDFVTNKVTFTQFNFFRDLHCWQITGTWTPFGPIQGFQVTIGAKSALLQDLKLNRNRTFQNR